MRKGYLSDVFVAVGVKKLAVVDVLSPASDQHEVTGSEVFRRILGEKERKKPKAKGEPDARYFGTYIRLHDEEEALTELGRISWYDCRKLQPKRAPEWRLYYQGNAITRSMRAGDYLFVVRKKDDILLFIVVPEGSTVFTQLLWLFGLAAPVGSDFIVQEMSASSPLELGFAARYILDELGVDFQDAKDTSLDRLLKPYKGKFPTTKEFSKLARDSVTDVDPQLDPDAALTAWLEKEELLFRRLEHLIVAKRLKEGFGSGTIGDVDEFLSFSLSVQNRRKSRAGHSLENHLQVIFEANRLQFARGAETEKKNKPDFLFPGQAQYLDPLFGVEHLTMLGAKSTLKDRWRQVLAEAAKIRAKHLITLEPGISRNQTEQMEANFLQLVIPQSLHVTFHPDQQAKLLNLREFIKLVQEREI